MKINKKNIKKMNYLEYTNYSLVSTKSKKQFVTVILNSI